MGHKMNFEINRRKMLGVAALAGFAQGAALVGLRCRKDIAITEAEIGKPYERLSEPSAGAVRKHCWDRPNDQSLQNCRSNQQAIDLALTKESRRQEKMSWIAAGFALAAGALGLRLLVDSAKIADPKLTSIAPRP